LNGDENITNAAGEEKEILDWNTDECVLFEVHVGGGPRGLAVDVNNNLWVGTMSLGGGNKFYHINGSTGTIIAADTIDLFGTGYSYRSYGAVIDENGYIWSSSLDKYVLKIDPTTKAITKAPLDITSYGLGIDGNGHLFVASWGQNLVAKIDINNPNNPGTSPFYASQHCSNGRGVAVTTDGNVWLVDSYGTAVNRFDNNLNYITTIDIGSTGFSTGVAVDATGKVWACNYDDGYLHRIDPATNSIELSKFTPGYTGFGTGMHYSYSDMTGFIAWSFTTKKGTWTVDFDSKLADARWGKVSWNSYEPTGTSVTVKVRSSTGGSSWTSWESASNGVDLISTPDGRYLQIETTLQITSGDVSPILYDLTVEIVLWQDINKELDALIAKVNAAVITPDPIKTRLVNNLKRAKAFKERAKEAHEAGDNGLAKKYLKRSKRQVESFSDRVKITDGISQANKDEFLEEAAKIKEKIDNLIENL
jgi:sugar lactone lactonase YvrE